MNVQQLKVVERGEDVGQRAWHTQTNRDSDKRSHLQTSTVCRNRRRHTCELRIQAEVHIPAAQIKSQRLVTQPVGVSIR